MSNTNSIKRAASASSLWGKNFFRFITGFVILWFAWQGAIAQSRTVTGVVKDNKGEAVIGASVAVKGTSTGTYTDAEGNFSIVVPSNGGSLVTKYLGYKTSETPLGASNTVSVTLEEDVLGLNEVVVTALGIPKEKKALGYSAQAISGDELNKSGQGNPLSELNGKISGLTVINSSGDPGGGTYIRLRGVTSLTGNNQPLIIVDGIPLDNSINIYDPVNTGFTAGTASGNNLGSASPDNRGVDINPADIASITVLKGPAATALYGLQAASGALIITTKKGGGVGKKTTNVSFQSSFSLDLPNKLPDLQTRYGQGTNGEYLGPTANTSNNKFSWGPLDDTLYWDGIPTEYDQHGSIVGQSDPSKQTKLVPYDQLNFFTTGSTFNNSLALSGGNENSGYRLSVGNINQQGIVPLTNQIKTTVSLSGQATLMPKLKSSASLNYINSGSDKAVTGSNPSGVMLGLLRSANTFDNSNGATDPNDPAAYILADGSQRDYRGGAGYDNPYWVINRNPFRETLNRFYGSVELQYDPFRYVSILYRVGGDVYNQENKNGYDIGSNQFGSGLLILDNYHSQQVNSDLIVSFNKDFGKDFNLSVMVGQNYFTNNFKEEFAQGNNLSLPNFFDMSNASSFFTVERTQQKRTMAVYGQAQLEFKDMLYLTLTGRNETSSTLPAENNTFFYPSVSVGWVFTEPLGLSSNNIFPYGKIRFSYAQVGKDALPQSLKTYYVSSNPLDGFTSGLIYPFNGVGGFSLGSVISVIGNPNLKPENTNSFEAGFDLAFFRNRIGLSATYYNAKTTNQIFTVAIPYTTGFASVFLNAGEITNQGLEVTLNLTPVKTTGGFQWDMGFNWSMNRNKVVALAPGIDNLFVSGFLNGGIYAVTGMPYGIIYGNAYERADDGQLIINDDPNDPGFGKPIGGVVNKPIGDVNPDWIGSLVNTFSFKGWSLGCQIDVREGGDIWNGTKGALEYFGTAKATDNRGSTAAFSGDAGHIDLNGNIVHYGADGTTEEAGPGAAVNNQSTLDQYYYQFIGSSFIGPAESSVEDGSFVRIRELTLGYSVPSKLLTKIHISQLAITAFANNAFLSTKYSGVDPETSLIGPANGQGLDWFNNPSIKSYGLRLNIGL